MLNKSLIPVQIICDMLDDDAAKAACEEYINERASRGLRSLGVAKSVNGGKSWLLVGLISLLDPPREDSVSTIRLAQGMGVQVLGYSRLLSRYQAGHVHMCDN